MADEPTKPASPTHPASEDVRSSARQWFAEAREASAKDDAEVKSWKMEMREFGYCLSDSLWQRITWSVDQPFLLA